MVHLYGQSKTRHEIAAAAGDLSQFAGVRLMTLADGLERGIRLLEFRTGTGLRFTVLIDRALDIADCDYCGMAIGWHSPAGFRHPGLHEYGGEAGLAWLRSFSGLMVTCGLDHILGPCEEPADHYLHDQRPTVGHAIHGRIGTIPARLTGYGERWDADRCTLWCEGSVIQGTVFGEHLELIRRIEVEVGTNTIRLVDTVVNRGFYRTPHMFCYHINVGYPVLAEGARFLAPVTDVVWAVHDGKSYREQQVGYQKLPGPRQGFREQVWQHETGTDGNGETPLALVNDALGIGFEVTVRKDQFPCLFEWQNLQSGQYAFGIEPSTNHVLGHAAARQRGELIWLEHGEEKRYDTRFQILAGANEIAASAQKIHAIATQPEADFPHLSGNHTQLAGRS
jgi:uncharacterized protein DUF4432